ncbi:unnamed protein product [Closterium sp. NIES-65]|nr:unnamed protein product [Closterium sp. NIES-65]
MSSQRLVLGLPRVLPSLPPSLAPPCGPCVEGRLRAAPHSSSLRPATEPFETLHLDVWGPAPRLGPERERYFLVVVDDFSRYTTVFPLAKKSEVTSTLIRYAAHQLNLWPRVSRPEVSPTTQATAGNACQQLFTPLLKVVGAGGARPAQGGAELVVRGSAVGITSRQLLPGLREVLREVLREMLTHDKVLENLAAPIRTNANRTALQVTPNGCLGGTGGWGVGDGGRLGWGWVEWGGRLEPKLSVQTRLWLLPPLPTPAF